jgi:hypothetical protein
MGESNAGTRNRTTDAGIFSPSLYLLSYPGKFEIYHNPKKSDSQEPEIKNYFFDFFGFFL